MWVLNSVVGRVFDVLFLPFRGISPWFGLVAVSLLTAFLMLWIFRAASNQAGIRRAKNDIKAHLLELRLFKDNMRVSLRAQGRILRANLRYIALNAKPLAVMIIPLVLILAQLNLRFGYEPLRPGGTALVKIRTEAAADPVSLPVSISPTPEIRIETPAVRITEEREISWRIGAVQGGKALLTFETGGRSATKSVNVSGTSLSVVSPLRSRGFLDGLLYPGEKKLPEGLPFRSIEIRYPARRLNAFGLDVHWIVAYFVLSVVLGFAFKGAFKVEI